MRVEMPRSKVDKPTERELDILKVLWERGPSSVREVFELLNRSEDLSFTTIQTMLQVMFDKDLVEREMMGRSLIYTAKVKREVAERAMVGDLLERVFGGSAQQLLARALDVKKASPEELKAIQHLIDKTRKGKS
jgi:BlaI family transcriptional regulator, penicillinase repressor